MLIVVTCKSLAWLSQHATKNEDKGEPCKFLKEEDLKHKGVILDRTNALPRLCKVQSFSKISNYDLVCHDLIRPYVAWMNNMKDFVF